MRRYVLLLVICLAVLAPDIFAQDATPEPLAPTEIPADATERTVAALPTFPPLSETELATDGTQRPPWLDALTVITGLFTLGAVATLAVNVSRKRPEVG